MVARSALLALLLCLAAAAPAGAGWFPADAIDGPSPDVLALGEVDLARDGTGAVVYVKREAGVPHIFLSRIVGGVWRAPERVDTGLEEPSSAPVVAVGEDQRFAVAWVTGGKLYGASTPGGAPGTLSPPVLLHDPGAGEAVADPHADLGINGTAYVAFSAPGGGGRDVRAVRLAGTTWEAVPAPLDIETAREAGAGAGRPRIAVSAEGNAVAIWGEATPERRRVYARRVTGLTLSVAPQEVSLGEFEGAAGGDADSPDLDIEDDGSYAWAVLRQDFGGTSRAISRRLVGSAWEPAVSIDGGAAAESPRVAINGRGVGIGAAAGSASRAVQAALIEKDAYLPSLRVDQSGSSGPPLPVVDTGEREDSAIAWRSLDPLGVGTVVARYRPEGSAYDPETRLSVPEFGPAAPDGLEIASDRVGDMAVAFLQGGPESRRLVVAVYDRPPGSPIGLSSSKYQRRARARLKWRPGIEEWGQTTFRVFVDGQEVGKTDRSSFFLPQPAAEGPHRWNVIAVDRRGQETPMKTARTFRVDTAPPALRVRVTGVRKRGMALRIRATAGDPGGSGVKYVQMDFGDGGPRFVGTDVRHRYRSGKFTLTVKAVDRAGNVTRRPIALRIKK